jgi:branched-subunit amino acid ABC-type transport system permease component
MLSTYVNYITVDSQLQLPAALALLLAILLFRPSGLFGRTVVRRV